METINRPAPVKEFKGQLPEEKLICVFRNHWVSVVPSVTLSIVLMVLLITLGIFIPIILDIPVAGGGEIFVALLISILVGALSFFIHRVFLSIFHYYLKFTILTNLRLITLDKSVFMLDLKDSVELDQVQDVQKIQEGFIPNMLDYGSISMTVMAVPEARRLDYVPKPDYYFKQLSKAKAEFQGHKGTIQEDVKNENQQQKA